MFKCTSCSVSILAKDNFVTFLCPNCGKEKIVRCSNCKNQSVKYTCKSCNFTGP